MRKALTKEGRKKLESELEYLYNIEQKRVINELEEARDSGGSIEENTQYMIAKDEYEKLKHKIEKIQSILSNCVLIDSENIDTSTVKILTKVKILNLSDKNIMEFLIVPENEIDLKKSKISAKSPIGSGLINKKVDDICEIKIPSGILKYKILEINLIN
jgi:transcription elongation factor GreA